MDADADADAGADDDDGLSTCRHGLRYDASQHMGCVVCRREAGIPSTMPAPPPEDGEHAAKMIYIALGALVLLVGVGVAVVQLLPPAQDEQAEQSAQSGLQSDLGGETRPIANEDLEPAVGSSELLAEAGRLEAERRSEELRLAAADRQDEAARRAEALERASENVVITMYTTSWCPVCVRAKQFMEAGGIRYTERNVEDSETARAACLRLNPRCSVPTIDIDGEVLIGFSAGGIQAAIARAAEQRL